MSFYKYLIQQTEKERQYLLNSRIINRTFQGDIDKADYIAFLTEAYHHVKHTVPLLMTVGSCLGEDHAWVQPAVVEYIEEESGHEEWVLNDIEACGGNRQQVKDNRPGPETELMIAYAYDSINRVNPMSFFGMVLVLEGTSVKLATRAADNIQQSLGLPNKAFSYLRSHGSLDLEHIDFFASLMNRVGASGDQADIIHAARMFYRLYANIFRTLDQNRANAA